MREQTFLCLGAGEAATGISDLLVAAMRRRRARRNRGARQRCWLVDSKGLVVAERSEPRRTQEVPTRMCMRRSRDFIGAVKALKPTAIIGVSATPDTFNREP